MHGQGSAVFAGGFVSPSRYILAGLVCRLFPPSFVCSPLVRVLVRREHLWCHVLGRACITIGSSSGARHQPCSAVGRPFADGLAIPRPPSAGPDR